MNDATQHRIDRLMKSARNAASAKNRIQREAAQAFLITRADELNAERKAMEERLAKMWDWLDRQDAAVDTQNVTPDRRYIEREDTAIAYLHDYEAVCDALDAARGIWLRGEAAA
jgi:hypothetical protein